MRSRSFPSRLGLESTFERSFPEAPSFQRCSCGKYQYLPPFTTLITSFQRLSTIPFNASFQWLIPSKREGLLPTEAERLASCQGPPSPGFVPHKYCRRGRHSSRYRVLRVELSSSLTSSPNTMLSPFGSVTRWRHCSCHHPNPFRPVDLTVRLTPRTSPRVTHTPHHWPSATVPMKSSLGFLHHHPTSSQGFLND